MSIAIEVENLSKKYIIGHQKNEGYETLREKISHASLSLYQRVRHPLEHNRERIRYEEFWALKDINFEVRQGERLGIVGGNGAGKSTLLKILSRITEPSTGKVRIKGRVASLLEVGTGFHPELSGRENIFLNGAILGMRKAEILRKFDEIVAFAEVNQFLDTPVKRYSSGMYVRLAFAIAAHLEPEILIVDEVLAVGDMRFQKKCIGKMNDVSREGRTILFVSHNLAAVSILCENGLLLDKGVLQKQGLIKPVIEKYSYDKMSTCGSIDYRNKPFTPGDSEAKLLEGRIENKQGKSVSDIMINEEIVIVMKYKLFRDNMRVYPNFHFFNSDGVCVFVCSDIALDRFCEYKNEKGVYLAKCFIPANFMNDNTYCVGLALTTVYPSVHVHFFEKEALLFKVTDPVEGTITRVNYSGPFPGEIRPVLPWSSEKLS